MCAPHRLLVQRPCSFYNIARPSYKTRGASTTFFEVVTHYGGSTFYKHLFLPLPPKPRQWNPQGNRSHYPTISDCIDRHTVFLPLKINPPIQRIPPLGRKLFAPTRKIAKHSPLEPNWFIPPPPRTNKRMSRPSMADTRRKPTSRSSIEVSWTRSSLLSTLSPAPHQNTSKNPTTKKRPNPSLPRLIPTITITIHNWYQTIRSLPASSNNTPTNLPSHNTQNNPNRNRTLSSTKRSINYLTSP